MKTDERPRFGIEEPADDGGMSALKAGLIVAGLVVVLLAILILTRPAKLDPEPVTLQPSIPTEAEAEAIAEELFARLDTMYRTRDITLVDQVFVAGSSNADAALKELKRLAKDGVLDESDERTIQITISIRAQERVGGKRVYLFVPRFLDEETGKEVTQKPGRRFEETLEFELVRTEQGWRIDLQNTIEQERLP